MLAPRRAAGTPGFRCSSARCRRIGMTRAPWLCGLLLALLCLASSGALAERSGADAARAATDLDDQARRLADRGASTPASRAGRGARAARGPSCRPPWPLALPRKSSGKGGQLRGSLEFCSRSCVSLGGAVLSRKRIEALIEPVGRKNLIHQPSRPNFRRLVARWLCAYAEAKFRPIRRKF